MFPEDRLPDTNYQTALARELQCKRALPDIPEKQTILVGQPQIACCHEDE